MVNSLYVAWRSAGNGGPLWGPIGKLEYDERVYRFLYTKGATTLPGFRPFSEMPELDRVYESEKLFPLFANRLLSRSRPEYEAFLAWGGFDPADPPDPIAILGVTEGIRQTDAIEVFPCPQPDDSGCYVNKFFLHGIRWMEAEAIQRVSKLEHDEELAAVPEPENARDPNAVAVWALDCGRQIGYVPRYLAREVLQLIDECDCNVGVYVERVNLDAPLQQRVLCRMVACWPEGFRPCSQPEFEPILSPAPHGSA